MNATGSNPLWYKDAVIYELHIKSFFDSNADGRGDFRGLTRHLDYIQDLGVTAIWLLPFYPSPLRDDGYDIADYRNVHPDYGTMRDFKRFVREAHRRGLRVITELVINHTSDQHPWFQAARRAPPGSARRNMYVWSDSDETFAGTRIIFSDTESSNWAWDPVAGAYYWHRFYSHQPDLNLNNPRVVREVGRVLRFWLDTGVDGLRLDAVPYLCVREGTNNENLPETHAVIKELRRIVDEHYDDRMLLAEANQWPADVREYFGDGDECHMAFHFPLMPRLFMALRQEDRRPIADILAQTPQIPDTCQWALFLRNHDELTLEMVTDEERDYMYREYAEDPRMRLNLGIRRRLAPLVNNSRRRIEMLHGLLLSMPGTPVIYYGDELGMGDNIHLGDRDGVRTPMQWNADRNAGFSRADPGRLYLPPIMDPVYGYGGLNVEAQERDSSSLLQFFRRLIALRRQHKAFGRGAMEMLAPRNRRVLAFVRHYRGEVILVLANLSRFVQPAELDLSQFKGWTPLEMMGRTEFPPIGDLPYFLTLGPHAFYWFRLEPQSEPLHLSDPATGETEEIPSIGLDGGFDQLFEAEYRYTLVEDVVIPYLLRQRWYQGKAREMVNGSLVDACKLGAAFHLFFLELAYADGGRETYALPVKLARGAAGRRVVEQAPASVLAHVHSGDDEGVLFDALADRTSCLTTFRAMTDGRTLATAEGGRLRGFTTSAFPGGRTDGEIRDVRRLSVEQSNTSVVLDDRVILKAFRRLEPGPNPDLEIGRYLTEKTSFRNLAPVLGALVYEREGRATTSVVMAQAFVANQGDGWSTFQARLDEDLPRGQAGERTLADARTLGRRTAELHLALVADRRAGTGFAAVPWDRDALERLSARQATEARQVLETLSARASLLPEAVREDVETVLAGGGRLLRRFEALADLEPRAVRTRIHGDLHLGQVLALEDDFLVLDFEGEPLRPLAERRAKDAPLRDVAGMLRSFDYAAQVAARRHEAPPNMARTWSEAVAGAYRDAWFETAAGAPFLPSEPAVTDALLGAYVAEKALYELRYELNNRPDWVGIPLAALAAWIEVS